MTTIATIATRRPDGLFNMTLHGRHIGVAGGVSFCPHGRVKSWTPARCPDAAAEAQIDRAADALFTLFGGPPRGDVTTADGRAHASVWELDPAA